VAHLEDSGRRGAQEPGNGPVAGFGRASGRQLDRWLPGIIVSLALLLWEWAARSGRCSALFFPAPSAIARTALRLYRSGQLTANAAATLRRVVVGLAAGGVPALVLGLAMGWSRRLYAIVDPLIAALHPVPKTAILPLIMILFGIGETSKVVVVAMATFFPVLINAMAGVRQIHPIYFEVAENYGASLPRTFSRVVVPGSLPAVLTGIRLGLNTALVLTIAVELVAAREGLGAMIWFAWETLRTEELYAALAVAAALGIGFNVLVQKLSTWLVPWQVEREE
jgi:ABC-type nitrate/sulfonate/bicarbonate transport system permease component